MLYKDNNLLFYNKRYIKNNDIDKKLFIIYDYEIDLLNPLISYYF